MENRFFAKKEYDINLIKNYYYFSNILGLAPIYSFKESKLIHPNLYRIYVMILSTTLFLYYVYSTYGMYLQFSNGQATKIVFALELILFFLMNFICVYGMFKSTYKRGIIWMNFLNEIIKYDSGLNVENIEGKNVRTEVIGQIFFIIFLIVYKGLWWDLKGFYFEQYYLIEIIEYLYVYTIIVLASKFALSLKKRFKIYNELITRKIKETNNEISVIFHENKIELKLSGLELKDEKCKTKEINVKSGRNFDKFKKNNLKTKEKTHYINLFSNLSNLVELYNLNFGSLILIYLGRLLVGLLDAINYYLSYDSGHQDRIVYSCYIFLNFLVLVSKT